MPHYKTVGEIMDDYEHYMHPYEMNPDASLPTVPRDHYREDKRISPFIQLLSLINIPCTIRVSKILAIGLVTDDHTMTRVELEGNIAIIIKTSEVTKLHKRIEEYYGGNICPQENK